MLQQVLAGPTASGRQKQIDHSKLQTFATVLFIFMIVSSLYNL